MAWRIEVTPAAAKELRKLNRQVARRIGAYLQDLVCTCGDPRQRGKGLTANLAGLWRYRVVRQEHPARVRGTAEAPAASRDGNSSAIRSGAL